MSPRKKSPEATADPEKMAKSRAARDKSRERDDAKRAKADAKVAKKQTKVKDVVFKYEALNDQGEKVTGTEKAVSSGAVHVALMKRGLQPTLVEPKKSVLNFEITRKMVPRKEVMNFSRQLAVFIAAGIPIMDAMEVIVEETNGKMLKGILIEMVSSLRNGDTFAAAAAAHPAAFPNYYVGILESAELTGDLDVVLEQLADYMDRDAKARAKITSALIYPAVVAAMSVVTVLILAVFVLPRFVVFFNSLHAKLPLPTRMMLGASAFTSRWWYLIVLAILLLVAGFMTMRRVERGRHILDTMILKLPVIGNLTQTAILERVCRILSSLIRAGVDLPRSMSVVAESANNSIYRNALESVREDMLEGQGLAGPINRTNLFPGAARQMFRVGEETGTLDKQLEVAAEYYGRELETKVDHATSLFEPAIIIFMGVVVGFVAVALISAMYGIYRQVKVG
jgi:type IV pilus assembly protein PilC